MVGEAELDDTGFAHVLSAYGVLSAHGRARFAGLEPEDLERELMAARESDKVLPWKLRLEPGRLMEGLDLPDTGVSSLAWRKIGCLNL